jgi:hypothetical protein
MLWPNPIHGIAELPNGLSGHGVCASEAVLNRTLRDAGPETDPP